MNVWCINIPYCVVQKRERNGGCQKVLFRGPVCPFAPVLNLLYNNRLW